MRALRRCRLTRAAVCRRGIQAGVPPSAVGESHGATAPAVGRGFRSSTKFKLRPTQVNEMNVPSAREVGQMIPTLRELQEQLPGARELERTYIQPESVRAVPNTEAATASPAAACADESHQQPPAATAAASIFQTTTDPLEDLLFGAPREEGSGGAEATAARVQPGQHLLLAYRALMWGTLFALAGFTVTVAAAMYLCGYHSLRELQQGVRGKVGRDEERLRATAAQDGLGGDTVVEHYVIDLTHPTEAWRQVQEIWGAVQRLAEEEEGEEAQQHEKPQS